MDNEQALFRLFGKYCPEGTILYTEGSLGEELYFVQSGAVRLGAPRADGGASAQVGPGDFVGEEALLGRAARPVRAEIVQDARLYQVNERSLDALVRHGPETARRIAAGLLSRAAGVRKELAAWTVGHILQRVAPHLSATADGAIDPADLAERSGQAESDVRLVLDALQMRGGLAQAGSGWRVADPQALRRAVDAFTAGAEDA